MNEPRQSPANTLEPGQEANPVGPNDASVDRGASSAWLVSFVMSDAEAFEREDFGLPAPQAKLLRLQVQRILEPLRETFRGGLDMGWRLEAFRAEVPVEAKAIAKQLLLTSGLEGSCLSLLRAARKGAPSRFDALRSLETLARACSDELRVYQHALLKAVGVAEQLKTTGTDLALLLTESAAPATPATHLTLVAEAAFRLPFWTMEPHLLAQAAHIERACELGSLVEGFVRSFEEKKAPPTTTPLRSGTQRYSIAGSRVTVPARWRQRTEDAQGLSFELSDDQGRQGEVFLSLFGFEKKVPPLEVFLEFQRTTLGLSLSLQERLMRRLRSSEVRIQARALEDRVLAHPSGLPCHLLAYSSTEPTGEQWVFRAAFLRTSRAILLWKLDQPGSGSDVLAAEHLEAFRSLDVLDLRWPAQTR